jgi:NADH pyrophosphatase NudC (nudix superfamily)
MGLNSNKVQDDDYEETETKNMKPLWYTDPKLDRGPPSEIHSLTLSSLLDYTDENNTSQTSQQGNSVSEYLKSSRFIISFGQEKTMMVHYNIPSKSTSCDGEENQNKNDSVAPLYLLYNHTMILLEGVSVSNESMLVWIGKRDNIYYWAIYLSNTDLHQIIYSNDSIDSTKSSDKDYHRVLYSEFVKYLHHEIILRAANLQQTSSRILYSLNLREFGDQIASLKDAAILATANSLIEFHKSHQYCTKCGSKTIMRKNGTAQLCSNHISITGGTCKSSSIYPRIDVATIMLITSQCGNYALLGRKEIWPSGRYSTLAGFLETGETLEECCCRETFEESGIVVDIDSIKFIHSQPWPFPRSMMVGFIAKAKGNDDLPIINVNKSEMEDIQWFHRDFVAERMSVGSSALSYQPAGKDAEFHLPGKSSLARHLIKEWVISSTKG